MFSQNVKKNMSKRRGSKWVPPVNLALDEYSLYFEEKARKRWKPEKVKAQKGLYGKIIVPRERWKHQSALILAATFVEGDLRGIANNRAWGWEFLHYLITLQNNSIYLMNEQATQISKLNAVRSAPRMEQISKKQKYTPSEPSSFIFFVWN